MKISFLFASFLFVFFSLQAEKRKQPQSPNHPAYGKVLEEKCLDVEREIRKILADAEVKEILGKNNSFENFSQIPLSSQKKTSSSLLKQVSSQERPEPSRMSADESTFRRWTSYFFKKCTKKNVIGSSAVLLVVLATTNPAAASLIAAKVLTKLGLITASLQSSIASATAETGTAMVAGVPLVIATGVSVRRIEGLLGSSYDKTVANATSGSFKQSLGQIASVFARKMVSLRVISEDRIVKAQEVISNLLVNNFHKMGITQVTASTTFDKIGEMAPHFNYEHQIVQFLEGGFPSLFAAAMNKKTN